MVLGWLCECLMGFILRLWFSKSRLVSSVGRLGLREGGNLGVVLQRLLLEESVLFVVLLLVGLYKKFVIML